MISLKNLNNFNKDFPEKIQITSNELIPSLKNSKGEDFSLLSKVFTNYDEIIIQIEIYIFLKNNPHKNIVIFEEIYTWNNLDKFYLVITFKKIDFSLQEKLIKRKNENFNFCDIYSISFQLISTLKFLYYNKINIFPLNLGSFFYKDKNVLFFDFHSKNEFFKIPEISTEKDIENISFEKIHVFSLGLCLFILVFFNEDFEKLKETLLEFKEEKILKLIDEIEEIELRNALISLVYFDPEKRITLNEFFENVKLFYFLCKVINNIHYMIINISYLFKIKE